MATTTSSDIPTSLSSSFTASSNESATNTNQSVTTSSISSSDNVHTTYSTISSDSLKQTEISKSDGDTNTGLSQRSDADHDYMEAANNDDVDSTLDTTTCSAVDSASASSVIYKTDNIHSQKGGRKHRRVGGSCTTDTLMTKKSLKTSSDGVGKLKKLASSDGEDNIELCDTSNLQKDFNINMKDDCEMKNISSDILTSTTTTTHSESLKVPPLRIVLQNNNNSTNNIGGNQINSSGSIVVINSETGSGADNSNAAQTNSSNKYPYVVNSCNSGGAGNEQDTINDTVDSNATSISTTTTSHRITRSSQRVALKQQKHHSSDNEDQLYTTVATSGTRKKKSRGGGNQTSSHYVSNATNNSHSLNNQNDNDDNSSSSTASTTTTNVVSTNSSRQTTNTDTVACHYQYNPCNSSFRQFAWIREQVEKRRQSMSPIIPKLPEGYDNFLVNKRTYLLRGKQVPEHLGKRDPPSTLQVDSVLYKLFVEQEEKRFKMRLQHQVEKERMQVTKETQIVRVYNEAARAQQNQAFPLSACSYLKDEEVYNKVEFETDHSADNVIIAQIKEDDPRFLNDGPSAMSATARVRYTNRMLKQNLDSLEDKWNGTKKITFNRQMMEAQTLHAVQKMHWKSKVNELGLVLNDFPPNDLFVPMVDVTENLQN